MGSELVFTIADGVPKVATQRKLADAGLKERQDIEEWVIANPRLIGSDVLILTSEFAGWTSTKGAKSLDRLDILGLAEDGRLVVAELKRGDAPSTVEMQVLNYAARASLFKVDELVRVYQRFQESRGEPVSEEAAGAALRAHAAELSDDSLDYTPRVVVLAEDFGPDVTTTAHFLAGKLSLDIELIQLDAYETVSGELVISASTRYPPPDISQEILYPDVEETKAKNLEKTREKSTVHRLLAAHAIAEETVLRFMPGSEISQANRDIIDAWIGSNDELRVAKWRDSPTAPLVWQHDGKAYSPTGLVKLIAGKAGLTIDSVAGPRSWQDSSGRTLPEIVVDAESQA